MTTVIFNKGKSFIVDPIKGRMKSVDGYYSRTEYVLGTKQHQIHDSIIIDNYSRLNLYTHARMRSSGGIGLACGCACE